jgi:hypothetical protein
MVCIIRGVPIFTSYEVRNATTGNTYATVSFTQPVYRLDILVETNDAIIQLSSDGTTFGSDIILVQGAYSIDTKVKAVKHRSRVSGNSASLQLVGWF